MRNMVEARMRNPVMRAILILVILCQITVGQQPHPFPKGYGHTPSPIGNRIKGIGDSGLPNNQAPVYHNIGPKFPNNKGQPGERPVQAMYQDPMKQGQMYRRVGQNVVNSDQSQTLNFNHNQPNEVKKTAYNSNIKSSKVSNNQNLLVNQNPIQENSRRVINNTMNRNAFRVPVNRNNSKMRRSSLNDRPVNDIKGTLHQVGDNGHIGVKGDLDKTGSNVPGHQVPDRGQTDGKGNSIKSGTLAPVPVDLFDKRDQDVARDTGVTPKKPSAGNTNIVGGSELQGKVKIIDGEVEKKIGKSGTAIGIDKNVDDNDEDYDEDEEDEGDEEYDGADEDTNKDNNINTQHRQDQPSDTERHQLDNSNIIPRERENMNNQVINDNVFPQGNHFDQRYPDNVNGVPNMESVLNTDSNKQGSLKVVWDWSDFAVNFEQYVMPEQKIRRAPHATTGQPWPLPQYYVSKPDKVYRIDKNTFRFKLSKIKCDVIEKAVERYKEYVLEDAVEDMYDNFQHAQGTMFEDPSQKYDSSLYLEAPSLSLVLIKIRKPCAKFPTTKMDESYDLFVKRAGIHILANEVWGALRGLETFSQLVFKGTNQLLYIRDTVINDYPRFSHRGVMIDSSRHFMFKETIYDVLEGMAQNKMNVLHWHLVDDQSFPFYSSAFPDLSAKGAFHPTFVYMPEDIADVIEFARLRGIRVEPEFDTPGHTYSWGLSRPDILTQCYQGERPVEGYLGPMDPSKNETFRFLKTFFKDVMTTFKDEFLHLGGDEVPMTCWQSNPEVMKFLAKLEGRVPESPANDPYYYSYDIRKVLEYYVTRLITDLKSLGTKRKNGVRFVFWQEIMNNNVQLPNDTIIHVWQGGMEDVQRATSLGLNVIYSTCWYLDQIEYGTKWSKYYQCDPADLTYGYTIDESKVLGGEACLWAEYIENENAMVLLWPRASAAAERLWSHKDVKDLDTAAARLQEHRCRMLSRGLGVGQISGPDYCLKRGKRRWHFNETNSNCTHCGSYNENSRVEVEKIKVEFEQKGGHISDCSQAVIQAGGQLTIALLIIIVIAVGITLKVTKQKINQVRVCRNRTILLVFVTLILVYFMCYTSIWMQAMQFRGSFEKRVSSNVQKGT